MSVSKINPLLLAGLFSVLLFSGCGTSEPVEPPTLITETIEEVEVDVEEEVDTSTLTEEEGNAYFLDLAIDNKADFDNAIIHQDESMCEVLESDQAQYSCSQNILMTKAIASNDIDLCDELETDESIEKCQRLYEDTHPPLPESFIEETEIELSDDIIVSDPLEQTQ